MTCNLVEGNTVKILKALYVGEFDESEAVDQLLFTNLFNNFNVKEYFSLNSNGATRW